MKKNLFNLSVLLILMVSVTSCSKDDGPPVVTLEVDTIGLENLTSGSTYQGWLIVDGVSKPTNKFTNVSQTVQLTVLESDAQDATGFYITVEGVGDNDNLPSDAIILSGTFNGNSATLKNRLSRLWSYSPSACTVIGQFRSCRPSCSLRYEH